MRQWFIATQAPGHEVFRTNKKRPARKIPRTFAEIQSAAVRLIILPFLLRREKQLPPSFPSARLSFALLHPVTLQ